MEVRDKIIEKAGELYMQYGIRTVTMDDIASQLSISKKTIYQFFKDKGELVNTVAAIHLKIEEQRFIGLTEAGENAVHELILLSTCLRESMREMKMNLMHELQKFYPKAWKMYEEFKGNVMKESIMSVIIRGQKEGFFRKEINAELMAIMRIEQVQTFIIGNLIPRNTYSLEAVQMQLFDHFIHGLFTIEGHQLFNQYLTTNNEKNEEQN
ncbi:MAG: AcrR family transcriptional regulator [Roseivirga sp.]|jgi:AcrR family transcriptional regulator